MISGFIIFAIVVNCGGAGDDGYIGAKNGTHQVHSVVPRQFLTLRVSPMS